jgi:hypothetical protein
MIRYVLLLSHSKKRLPKEYLQKRESKYINICTTKIDKAKKFLIRRSAEKYIKKYNLKQYEIISNKVKEG